MTKIIGFISEKGGTGKTTSCYHIAVALTRYHKKKVLVVDADYQRGGITGRFFPDMIESFGSEDNSRRTLFHHFQQLYSATTKKLQIDILPYKKWWGKIDVIAADSRLSSVSTDKLPSSNNIRANNSALLEHLQCIHEARENIKANYDYILIDSHPEVSDVLRSIIYASDYCVSPFKLDRQSSIGVATVSAAINNVNDDVQVLQNFLESASGYLPTQFSGSIGMMAREWDQELKQSEKLEYRKLLRTSGVFKHYVTEGDGLRQAAAQRIPVYDLSFANAEKQAQQFRNVTKEIIAKCP